MVGIVTKIALAFGAVALSAGTAFASPETDFENPPPEARPRVWWHWMNGNVTKAGITADLESMKAAGIAGACVFDVGCSLPPGCVKFNTPAWDEHLRFAAQEAERLGLELTLVNCSGFANAGGPWVAPSNSMFSLTCSETRLRGGSRHDCVLPRRAEDNGFYRDIAIIGFPLPEAERTAPARIDAAFDETRHVVTFSAGGEPFALRGISFSVDYRAWAWCQWIDGTVESSDDGTDWRRAAAFSSAVISSGRPLCEKDTVFASFNATVRGRFIRVRGDFSRHFSRYEGDPCESRFRAVVPEARMGLPELSARLLLSRGEMRSDVAPSEPGVSIDLGLIRDLTRAMSADGRLVWDVPDGEWVVLRIGYFAKGTRVSAASAFGAGLEVDKLDAAAVARHFDAYVGRFADERSVTGLLVDSWEAGTQNWTHGLEGRFAARYGYSIVPYLAALSGRTVGSPTETDRALRDFRRLVSEEFCSSFVGTLRRKAAAHGLSVAVEPDGNAPADIYDYDAAPDIPMTEFWVGPRDDAERYRFSSDVHFVAARRLASSARLNGRRIVEAEAFSANPANGGRWLKSPFGFKAMGDRFFACGVNRCAIHRFAHQPWTEPMRVPGMTMGPWGSHFERTETWWPFVGPFIAYLSRCQALLQNGLKASDVIVYTGDECPQSGVPEEVPSGVSWDVCGGKGLETVARDWKSFGYKALVVPTNRIITAEHRALVGTLRESGVRVFRTGEPICVEPDFRCLSQTSTPVRFIRRHLDDGRDIYFVASSATNDTEAVCSFRQEGRFPQLWDPETGRRMRPRRFAHRGNRTEVTLALKPSASLFVVFADAEDAALKSEPTPPGGVAVDVKGPWRLSFPVDWYSGGDSVRTLVLSNLVDWTRLDDPEMRYFSGIATYRFDVAEDGELDLGEVREVAEVTDAAGTKTILWRPPFRVRVVAGPLTVRVANLWPNRLIGDAKLTEDCAWQDGALKSIPQWVRDLAPSPTKRRTFTTWRHWKGSDEPLRSGLLGPVRLVPLPKTVFHSPKQRINP